MLEFSDYLFISLGPHCYMRGLLRKIIKNNPNDPWVWQHFFDITTYKMFLNEERIKLVANDLNIISNTDTAKIEFWSENYKLYTPHINEKIKFTSLENSRQLYYEVTVQRLERLKSLVKNKKIVFLTNTNRSKTINGKVKEGFNYKNYEKNINDFLKEFCTYLNVAREDCYFWIVDKKEKLAACFKELNAVKIDEDFNVYDILNIKNGSIIETIYSPESFSYETGEGLEDSKKYWFSWFEKTLHFFKNREPYSISNNCISLFTTFFLTPDKERQQELLFCLNKNLENDLIKNVFLLLDNKDYEQTVGFLKNSLKDINKIQFINVGRVPTYGDWINYSITFEKEIEETTVFINSDIFLDDSIAQLNQYTQQQETIVCLSRHEYISDTESIPHANPHWSQDLWAISKNNLLSINNSFFINELNINPTGVYRCDNKLAYIFAMRGWVIFNPFPSIKCYHVQKSAARAYGKLDTNIVGGLCFPEKTDSPSNPSVLDISIMPVKVNNIKKCTINKYLEKNLHSELTQQKVEIVKDFKPLYTWPSKAFPFREYFSSENLKIFIIENVIHNYEWLNAFKDKITNNHFFFVILCWNHSEYLWKNTNEIFNLLKLNKNNFFFMCNSKKELQFLTKYNFKGDLINHNAWLDENLYTIKDISKIYNALYIARKANFKRHYLASNIANLALIAGGANHGYTEEIILPPHIYNNKKQLTLNEVVDKINESHTGLCLSKEEGACYASSEYLLCGIPVVSTKSEGGRDFWYEDYNSIICEDNEESVAEAVNFFLNNKRDPEIIRSNHIALAKQQRAKFIKILQQVFFENNIDINAYVYFRDNFINKMRISCTPNFNQIFS